MNINLTVNGQSRTAEVEPRKTLADTLREDLDLTGTHLGCEHGVCGAWRDLVDDCADSIVELKVDGEVSRIATPTPDETAAEMLQAALARGASVERLEIIRPSLETVYLSVVGRRYEGAS